MSINVTAVSINVTAVSTTMAAAPPETSHTASSASALPKHVVDDARSLVALRTLVGGVRSSASEQKPGHEAKHRRSKKSRQTEVEASAAAIAPAPPPRYAKRVHVFAGCPHCPAVKRGNRAHRTSCPFELWKADPDTAKPSRSFDAELGQQLNLGGAWRRKYNALTQAALLEVCRKYGCKEHA
jgi:hypothetical protein